MVRTASTMLPIGTLAPSFLLPDTTSTLVGLAECKKKHGLVVAFLCNHCPYVKHVAPELKRIADEYARKEIGFVGINSNDATVYPEDSPQAMVQERSLRGYEFPYLYDETQQTAVAYRAACTPDFFVFDRDLRLVYRGQMDDSRPKTDRPLTGADLRSALDNLLAGKPVSEYQRPSIGCNIKWRPGNEPEYFNPSGVAAT